MSRVLSPAMMRAVLAQNTAEVPLACLTIAGAGFTTFRVVNDTRDLIRGADVFTAFPFAIVWPDDKSESIPGAQIQISNVSRDIVAGIRAPTGEITATLELVLASQPTTVEMGPMDLKLLSADYDVGTITFKIGFEQILAEPFPAGTYDPKRFPGIF